MANETRPFAVITGASMGIGFHLANVFAQHGYDLLITSGSEKIEEAGREFEASNVQVQTVEADLRTYEGVEKLWEAVRATGRQVDVVALNAGVGVGGDFARETDLQQELELIALNV
ncbi:MAG TPA: SDR family NAD(P)-dependent oxidoreductase, partial [Candidatus Acidoferrum sp.]|nr:SDR family NAD(P)-dependent oxidoreductase [Candidatus Acidoferrum sp.]